MDKRGKCYSNEFEEIIKICQGSDSERYRK